MGAKDKAHALALMLPYIIFFVMFYAGSLSRFWTTYSFLFVMLHHLYLTYVTGHFNLLDMAGRRFDPLYLWDPLCLAVILYADVEGLATDEHLKLMYCGLFLEILFKYLYFMYSTI